jgi:EAL domain-containing protein (putative c-di-GMP-specific phosphodiesterase class I)/CheY-like chemotaxis protein
VNQEHPTSPENRSLRRADGGTPRRVVLIGGCAPFAELAEATMRGASGGPAEFACLRAPDDWPLRDIRGACLLVDLGPQGSGLSQLDRVLSVAPHAPIVAVTEHEDDERGLRALERGAQEHVAAAGCTGARLLHAVRAAHERRRTALEREAADAFTAESASLVRAVLDSLDMMAVAIDGDGTIFEVNEPWRQRPPFSGAGVRVDIGDNYLEAAAQLAQQGSPELAGVLHGVRSVLARTTARYERVCRVSAAGEGRDLHVIALPLIGRPGAVVSHTDVAGFAGDAEAASEPLPAAFLHTRVLASAAQADARAAAQPDRDTVTHGEGLAGLRAEIERALEGHELSLAFQPIVATNSGRIVGAEALLRWRRLGGHWVDPAAVVAAAEQSGLIGRIGRWVLDTACARLKELDELVGSRRRLGVSINLSGMQLADPCLPDEVAGAIRASGCDPAAVCLEVTETAIADDMVAAAANLDVLRRLGVSIALDDFGTGYSSLQYAKHFRVNIVKIDKIFVQEIGRGGPDRIIVASVVSLAHGLGALVVAEGVETEEQRRRLAALDCDGLQGYLLSRPLTFEDFVTLCKQEQRWWERTATPG